MFNLTSDFKYAASQIQRDGSGLALWSPGPRGHFFPEHQDVVPRGAVLVCVCVCVYVCEKERETGKVQSKTAPHLYSFRNRCSAALTTSN